MVTFADPLQLTSCSGANASCTTTPSNIQGNCCESLSCVNGFCGTKTDIMEPVNATQETSQQIPRQQVERKYGRPSEEEIVRLIGNILEKLIKNLPKIVHEWLELEPDFIKFAKVIEESVMG